MQWPFEYQPPRSERLARRPQPRVAGPFGIITKSDFDRIKAEVKAAADIVDSRVTACALDAQQLDAGTATQWRAFYAQWNKWANDEGASLIRAFRSDTLLEYRAQVAAWQKRIEKAGCGSVGPTLDDPSSKAPSFWDDIPWYVPAVIVGGVVVAFAFSPIGGAVGAAGVALIDRVRK